MELPPGECVICEKCMHLDAKAATPCKLIRWKGNALAAPILLLGGEACDSFDVRAANKDGRQDGLDGDVD